MGKKVTIAGIILIILILIISGANFIIKPRKLYILKNETIPNEIIFNNSGDTLRNYKDNKELLEAIHKNITEKEFKKIGIGVYPHMKRGCYSIDYGYKRKSFDISSTGEIFICVRKSDIAKESIVKRVAYKINGLFDKSMFVRYKSGEDEELLKFIKELFRDGK